MATLQKRRDNVKMDGELGSRKIKNRTFAKGGWI
jgi:hypothetical protein